MANDDDQPIKKEKPPREYKKLIHDQAKEVIFNVIQFFETEKNNHGYEYPVEQVTKRAAAATGYSERTIIRIKKQGLQAKATNSKILTPKKKQRAKKIEIDDFQMVALRNIITNIYTVRKEVPTLKKILAAAQQDTGLVCGREYLRRVLVDQLGYRFKKCKSKRPLLIERQEVKLYRVKFIQRLQENEAQGPSGKPVVYLDEAWIHADFIQSTNWQQQTPNDDIKVLEHPPLRRWILLHAGGRMGFIPEAKLLVKAKKKNIEHINQVSSENFTKWLMEKLILNLPANSIIVLDHTPFLGVQKDPPPTSCATKEHMIEWMQRNKMTFDGSLNKTQLYEQIKAKCPPLARVFEVILKEHGHEILRLPAYNCDLNPMEYICNIIKQRSGNLNIPELATEPEKLTMQAIDTISTDDWIREMNYVKHLEQQYLERERLVEHEIETFIKSAEDKKGNRLGFESECSE